MLTILQVGPHSVIANMMGIRYLIVSAVCLFLVDGQHWRTKANWLSDRQPITAGVGVVSEGGV